MPLIDIPTAGGPTAGITPATGTENDLLVFFRELRAFIEIPVVQDLIRQRMNIGSGGSAPQHNIDEPLKLKKYNTSTGQELPKNATKKESFNPEQIILEQLATPEGRKSLSNGIGQVKSMLGDIKLSELQKELIKGDIKKK